MRYDGGLMSERPVEISETYTPGRNLGGTRKVTVDGIPAIELTYEGVTDIGMTFEVSERIGVLIERALESNDAAEQRITYTASDPGVPIDPRPWHERFPSRRNRRHSDASARAKGNGETPDAQSVSSGPGVR
jgi:hypothetical protein